MSKKKQKKKTIDPAPLLESTAWIEKGRIHTSESESLTSHRPAQHKAKRAVINGFIILHLVAIFCWAIPANSLLRTAINERFSPYLLWSGLWQGWDMFAPNPRSFNTYLEAEITFRNGQQRVWKFPRMNELGFIQRYFHERYRKWANDNVRLDENSGLWPDTARYIARLYFDASNPPQSVKLVRYWAEIPPPSGQFYLPSRVQWQHFVFFTYQVVPGDFS
jgi:hypothetical protein